MTSVTVFRLILFPNKPLFLIYLLAIDLTINRCKFVLFVSVLMLTRKSIRKREWWTTDQEITIKWLRRLREIKPYKSSCVCSSRLSTKTSTAEKRYEYRAKKPNVGRNHICALQLCLRSTNLKGLIREMREHKFIFIHVMHS